MTALRQVGRLVMVLVLVVGAAAVSLGLASVGRERPTADIHDAGKPRNPASATRSDSEASASSASASSALAASPRTAADLVAVEDRRVLQAVRDVPYEGLAYRIHGRRVDTLVLTARSTPYGRGDLMALGGLVRLSDGSDFLRTSVLVAPGAQLDLDGTRTLRLRSEPRRFVSIVAWRGALRITGAPGKRVSLTSWSLHTGAPDTDEDDGRAYVRTVGSSTELTSVSLHDLGFWSGRTGGLAVQGGNDAVAGSGTAPTVSLTDVTTHGLRYGAFLDDVTSATVRRSQLLDSGAQGLLLHGSTHAVRVRSTTVRGSGADGVTVGRGSDDIVLRDLVSDGNAHDGLRVDGRPIATGPTAGGSDPSHHGDVSVVGGQLSHNAASGITVVGADGVSVKGTRIAANHDGILVRGRADAVTLTGNNVAFSRGFGIGVTDGPTRVVVTDNSVDGAATGIGLRAAVATVRGNMVEHATSHGVSLVGRTSGSQVVRNALSGRGPAAIGLSHLVAPPTVVVAGNDVGAWDVHKDQTWLQRLLSHPLLLLWLPILLVPLLGVAFSLRRRRRRAAGAAARHVRLASASVPRGSTAGLDAPHPASLDPDPETRTRVTVMA